MASLQTRRPHFQIAGISHYKKLTLFVLKLELVIVLNILLTNTIMNQIDTIIKQLSESLKYFEQLKIELQNDKKQQILLFGKTNDQTDQTDSETEAEIDNNLNDTNTQKEEWKDIKIYGLTFNYQISNLGRVKNKTNGYILSQNLRDGYKSVHIADKAIKVHRLVGIMFIPNNDPNKTVVNHIDGDKFNNNVQNLEWTSIKDNNQHAVTNGLTKITKRRVTQMDMDGNEIQIFESLDIAKKVTGVDDGGIAKVCKGSRGSAGGFKWKYTDQNENERELTQEELELFVQVKDFPNYIIDSFGRVYSKPYKKFLKTVKTRENSQELQLTHEGNRKTVLLHNLVADQFIDKIEGKNEVGHKNGDKSDNRVDNLIRVSHAELCDMHKKRKNIQQNASQIYPDFVLDV